MRYFVMGWALFMSGMICASDTGIWRFFNCFKGKRIANQESKQFLSEDSVHESVAVSPSVSPVLPVLPVSEKYREIRVRYSRDGIFSNLVISWNPAPGGSVRYYCGPEVDCPCVEVVDSAAEFVFAVLVHQVLIEHDAEIDIGWFNELISRTDLANWAASSHELREEIFGVVAALFGADGKSCLTYKDFMKKFFEVLQA